MGVSRGSKKVPRGESPLGETTEAHAQRILLGAKWVADRLHTAAHKFPQTPSGAAELKIYIPSENGYSSRQRAAVKSVFAELIEGRAEKIRGAAIEHAVVPGAAGKLEVQAFQRTAFHCAKQAFRLGPPRKEAN